MKNFVSHESYYNCDDGCSVMKVTQYNTAGSKDPFVEVSIYPMFPKYRGWIQQLKWIWSIIKHNCVWEDQIVLGKEDMERLSSTLANIAKEIK